MRRPRVPIRVMAAFMMAAVVSVVVAGCGSESIVEGTATTAGARPEPNTAETTITSTPITSPTTTSAPTTEPARSPVFDFPTVDDVNEWFVVNDTVMGGVSTGELVWENGALVFTGDVSLANNGGFASIRSPFVDASVFLPWAASTGPAIELRGDGRTWTVEVRMDTDSGGGWISDVPTSADEFVVVELPWVSFEPVTRFLDPRETTEALDPSRIVSVAFYLVDGIEAPFRLELRSIS